MIPQQPRQHAVAAAAQSRLSTAMHADSGHDAVYHSLKKALDCLAGARDTSTLESEYSAFTQSMLAFEARMEKDPTVLSYLYRNSLAVQHISAAANSMDVILQDISGSLLDHSKLVDIVRCLCFKVATYMDQTIALKSPSAEEFLERQLIAAGLPAVLSRFTKAAWQLVQQLGSSPCLTQQQQQQRQQQHKATTKGQQHKQQQLLQQQQQRIISNRCRVAFTLIGGLLVLWQEFTRTVACPALSTAVAEALPFLVQLTTSTAPVLKQALDAASSSSSSSSNRLTSVLVSQGASFIATRGLHVAAFIASYLPEVQAPQEPQNAEQQWQQLPQQRVFFAAKLPELLLQLLAYQAGQLHTAYDGMSQTWQKCLPAAAATTGRQQQQQQFGGCAVPSSHLQLLQSVGLGHDGVIHPSSSDVAALVRHYGLTVKALADMVNARYRRTTANRNSTSSTHQDAGQQQQQGEADGDVQCVVPSHLLVAAIKVLIEVVLLVPPDESLSVHADSLGLILLLLELALTPTTAAAVAATAMGLEQVQRDIIDTVGCWRVLPAAVAAGLLQPVVAQLSQAVIYCLLQTGDHHQQQEVEPAQQEMAEDRLALLHCYGTLLVTVCLSVEPKHVAAVLQSQSPPELLLTLAAIEAVMRAQACHLAPEPWKQQQQSQQAELHGPARCITHRVTSPTYLVRGILQQPQDQAAWLLVPLALKVSRALLQLAQEPGYQKQWWASLEGMDSNPLLRMRLFTILNTVLTLCQAAATGIMSGTVSGTGAATQHTAVPCQLFEAMKLISAVFAVVVEWQECCSPSKGMADILPVVLLVRAVGIWSHCLSQVCQKLSDQHIDDTARTAASLGSLHGSVTDVTDVLQALTASAAATSPHDGTIAAASGQAAMHEGETVAEPDIPQQQQPA